MPDPHLVEIYPDVWRRLAEAGIAHPGDINTLLMIALAQRDAERVTFERTHEH